MRLSHLTQSSKKGPNEVDWAFKNWLENFLIQLTLSIAWITGMVCKVLGVKGFAAKEDLDCKEGESQGAWKWNKRLPDHSGYYVMFFAVDDMTMMFIRTEAGHLNCWLVRDQKPDAVSLLDLENLCKPQVIYHSAVEYSICKYLPPFPTCVWVTVPS